MKYLCILYFQNVSFKCIFRNLKRPFEPFEYMNNKWEKQVKANGPRCFFFVVLKVKSCTKQLFKHFYIHISLHKKPAIMSHSLANNKFPASILPRPRRCWLSRLLKSCTLHVSTSSPLTNLLSHWHAALLFVS